MPHTRVYRCWNHIITNAKLKLKRLNITAEVAKYFDYIFVLRGIQRSCFHVMFPTNNNIHDESLVKKRKRITIGLFGRIYYSAATL